MFYHSDITGADVCRNILKLCSHILIVLFLSSPMLHAQDMQITDIDLFIKEGKLVTRLHIQNFFNEQVKETIASGMSRRFNLRFELLRPGKKPILDRLENVSLKYDIWERIYIFEAAGSERQFDDFARFIHFFSDSTIFRLGNINRIDPDEQLQLYIIFSQQEISERQRKELKSWISREAETEESQPGIETNQSFSVNLSKLLSIFFSRQSYADLYVYKSSLFTIKSLYKNENTKK